ncbi:MAG: hypothetical protein ICV73_29540, partial [Acetobacteraceae bacterium]|nr:hypothetical protein [Acetobacteraceae bacterium]
MDIGSAYDRAGDAAAAQAAFEQAVRLAPHYARPRWQLGNFLLRSGRRREAFSELRLAATSDPALLPAFFDLAWHDSGGAAGQALGIVQPRTRDERLALALFFQRRGSTAEAVSLFRQSAPSPAERRRFAAELLAADRFREAHTALAEAATPASAGGDEGPDPAPGLTGLGFEDRAAEESAFDWQLPARGRKVSAVKDTQVSRDGAASLRVEWVGDDAPRLPVASRLVLVSPATRYRLSFAARTEDLVTGGLPLVLIKDAKGSFAGDGRGAGKDEAAPLARSPSMPTSSGGWQNFAVVFTTPP